MYTSLVRRSEIRPLIIECCYREVGCESASPTTWVRAYGERIESSRERASARSPLILREASIGVVSCELRRFCGYRRTRIPISVPSKLREATNSICVRKLRPQTRNIARSFSLAPNSLFIPRIVHLFICIFYLFLSCASNFL